MPSIVVLTGAGISAESGIPTFRGGGGLWEEHAIEDVATPEAFQRNPGLVQKFYNERRKKLQSSEVKPNAAHEALARLERDFPGEFLLVTQNIDNLHEQAGTKKMIHMHGELLEVRCLKSGKVHTWSEDVTDVSICPCCSQPKTLRPNIVWFGEMPFQMDEIFRALSKCTLFLSIGTSGSVYPAAGFVEHVRMRTNSKTIELNLEKSATNFLFHEHHQGPATQTVPKLVDKLLERLR